MTQPPPPDPRLDVRNGIKDSTVNGQAFQAGAVYGGVHFYNMNTPAPQPVAPVPQPVYLMPHVPVRRRSPVWAFVGRWFVALLPLLFSTAAIGGVADAVAANTNIVVRLLTAALVPAIGMAVIVLWSGVSGRSVAELLGRVLDKATPRALAAVSTSALTVLVACVSAMWLFGFITELVVSAADPKNRGATGALVFLATLAALAARLITQRRLVR